MRLPEITGLQFAVLSLLFAGEKTGRQLREELQRWGGPRTAAAFSGLMRRLQNAAYVDGERCTQAGRGGAVPECRYRVTDLGVIVWRATREFYAAFDPPPPELEVVATDEAEFADHDPKRPKALVKEKHARTLFRAFKRSWKAMRR